VQNTTTVQTTNFKERDTVIISWERAVARILTQ